MNQLAEFVVKRAAYAWLLATAFVMLVAVITGLITRDIAQKDRLNTLETEVSRLGVEVMSKTLNGNLMGALSLLGLMDPDVKQDARADGKDINTQKMLGILGNLGRSVKAGGVFIVGQNGIIQSSWDEVGKPSTGLDVQFRPYFKMAMQGENNVYAAVSLARGDRALYFSTPIRRDSTTQSGVIGAVVARTHLEEVDGLLKSVNGTALLLSPQGVVFASNQPKWIGHLIEAPTPTSLEAIRNLKQFGKMFEQDSPPVVPFTVQNGVKSEGSQTFAIASTSIHWNDPYGEWRLVVREDLSSTVDISHYFWQAFAAAIFSLLVLQLTLKVLRSRYEQLQATESLQQYADEQAKWAHYREQMASAATALQQAESIEAIGQTFLSTAHQLFAVQQGAIYVQASHSNDFVLVAQFGCQRDVAERISLGDGLLGQCLVERQVRILETPVNSPWKIVSGLGNTLPSAVFLSPILFQNQALGGLELATLQPFSSAQKEQLTALVDLLALNLNILQKTLSTQALLDEKIAAEQAQAKQREYESALKVAEKELARLEDIEQLNRLMLDREQRILELKKEVNALSQDAGKPQPYSQGLVETIGDHDLTPHPDYVQPSLLQKGRMLPLDQLVNIAELQTLFSNFCEAVGIAAAIIDTEGRILVSARWQKACTDFHRVNPDSCARCIESDTELSMNLQEGQSFTLYRCKNGMTDCAAPIVIEGQHLANVFIGQFHLSPPDKAFFKQQAAQFGYDTDSYIAAIEAAPIMNEQRLPLILSFLSGFAQMISTMSLARLRADAAQQHLEHQAQLLRKERLAAVSLAEDAQLARRALEKRSSESSQ